MPGAHSPAPTGRRHLPTRALLHHGSTRTATRVSRVSSVGTRWTASRAPRRSASDGSSAHLLTLRCPTPPQPPLQTKTTTPQVYDLRRHGVGVAGFEPRPLRPEQRCGLPEAVGRCVLTVQEGEPTRLSTRDPVGRRRPRFPGVPSRRCPPARRRTGIPLVPSHHNPWRARRRRDRDGRRRGGSTRPLRRHRRGAPPRHSPAGLVSVKG